MNEFKNIKNDLWKILILDILIFGSFATLYFLDQKNEIMRKLVEKLIKQI